MKLNELSKLYQRDLKRLLNELDAFENENHLWITKGSIANPAGNLILHMIGNLNHYFGAIILENGYKRNREFEFSGKKSLRELRIETESLISVMTKSFESLSEEKLNEKYPLEVFGEPMTYFEFIIHLYGHLNWHLGQLNYLRRLQN